MTMDNCEMKSVLMTYDSQIGRRRKHFELVLSDFEMDILRGCANDAGCSMSEILRKSLMMYYLEGRMRGRL